MASPPLSADPIAGGAKRPRSALDDVAVESTDPRSLSGAAAEASGRETSGKRPATGSARSAQSNAENRRALRAVIDSLQVIDGEELEPPTGSMNVPLLPHQRASLAWMVKREARSSPR